MPTAPQQTLASGQQAAITVKLFDNLGNEDTTSALSMSSANPANIAVAIDPTNNRRVICTALNTAASSGSVVINRAGTPVAGGALTVPFTLTAPVNVSRIEFVSCDPV